MDCEKFKFFCRSVHDADYCMIEKQYVTKEDTVFYGHLFLDNLRTTLLFSVPEKDLYEFTKSVNPKVKNYKVSKEGLESISDVDTYHVEDVEQRYSLYTLEKVKEKTFFNLLSELGNRGVLLKVKESLVPIESIKFSKNKVSVNALYSDKLGNYRTKRLMGFTDVSNLTDDLELYSIGSVGEYIKGYIAEGIVEEEQTELYNKPVYRYKINTEKLNCNPVNLNNIKYFNNKQMLLTVLAELDCYNAFFEGLDLGLKVMKSYKGAEEDYSGFSYNKRGTVGKNVRFNIPRKSFMSKGNADRLRKYYKILDEYCENDDFTLEDFRTQMGIVLKSEFATRNSEFANKGILKVLELAKGNDFLELKRIVQRIRGEYQEKVYFLNIYNYYWRSLYTDYSYLLSQEYGLYDGLSNYSLRGGAYDLEVFISF